MHGISPPSGLGRTRTRQNEPPQSGPHARRPTGPQAPAHHVHERAVVIGGAARQDASAGRCGWANDGAVPAVLDARVHAARVEDDPAGVEGRAVLAGERGARARAPARIDPPWSPRSRNTPSALPEASGAPEIEIRGSGPAGHVMRHGGGVYLKIVLVR